MSEKYDFSTNLYRHYKGQLYKYLGEVHHSESVETLALYEALFENAIGPLWVRPKEMFFETIEINGEPGPRFAPVTFSLDLIENPSLEDLRDIFEVAKLSFKDLSFEKLLTKLEKEKRILLLSASHSGKTVGFKLGYELDKMRFYSWLGAVNEEYRGYGLGQELMRHQHHWCRIQGFAAVEAKTLNQWKSMLLLSIKEGFQITGTEMTDGGETRILLRKVL